MEPAPDTEPDFAETLKLATRLKAAMQRKGRRQGWTRCPYCGGKVRARLVGRRDHLHMACETDGCIWVME